MSDDNNIQHCPKTKWILITICSFGNEVFRCPYATGFKGDTKPEEYAKKASLPLPENRKAPVQQGPDHQKKFAPGRPFWGGDGSPFEFFTGSKQYGKPYIHRRNFDMMLARESFLYGLCERNHANFMYMSKRTKGFEYKEII